MGVSNLNEYNITQKLDYEYKDFDLKKEADEIKSLYLNENIANIEKQLEGTIKQDISICILGRAGESISEMICFCSALRILYEKLNKKFKSIKIDMYLNASDNTFYSRDKMLFANQSFINKVSALSLNVKELCLYDFFIDLGSVSKRSYYKSLPHIDAWLYKLGIDYKEVSQNEKYNTINLSSYKAKKELKEKIENLKLKGKILLYHPYSANIDKSIPKEITISLLKELVLKLPDYTIVSVLKLDGKFEDDRFVDLSMYSKSFLDYSYIVSNMNKIVTVNTATYHMADAFFIPTVLILNSNDETQVIQEYPSSKIMYIKDKSKNFSNFIFENSALVLYKFDGWKSLKASKIIRALESF